MCALPFHRDRTMASAAASASTSGIGSPTYGRDVSETVHRRRHGRRALVQLGGQPGHIRLEPPRSAIDYGPQFIEHDGDVWRHADLISCVMAGLSLLDGAFDVNGTVRTHPTGA